MANPMLATKARSVVGYLRVSSEDQVREGVSLASQEASIRAYAAHRGIELTGLRIDGGESGKSLLRPQLQALLADVRDGTVGTIIVARLDRLTRRTRDLLGLIEDCLRPRAVELVSLAEQIDTSSPAGMMFLTVLGAMSQLERELIAERTRLALQHKKANGDRLGSPPLGFRLSGGNGTLTQIPGEVAAVRLILRRRRQGTSFHRIAAELTTLGHRTKRGGSWFASTVRAIWERRAEYKTALVATT